MKNKKSLLLFAFLLTAVAGFSQDLKIVKITDVEKIVAESKTPLIINMWATWCMPCIEELPYFQKEVRERNAAGDSIQLLLLSLDFKESFPDAIKKFMDKRKVTAPVLWLDETNADYFCPKIDAKWSGAIPATLFINNKSGYRKFIEEQISHETLRKEIKAIL